MGNNRQQCVINKNAGATARSTKWYIVNDQMVNRLIFDIMDYRIFRRKVANIIRFLRKIGDF